MSGVQLEIQAIAVVASVACALPGVFLVLRRRAMMSDAISHSVLLGIVLAFFLVEDLSSPLLVVGAALAGLLTVWLVELVQRTGLVREDAAIGLVFPALFSVGVILVSRYAGSVHLDTDAVLLGEIAFAPFDRFQLLGWDFGPAALVKMSVVLVLNAALIAVLWKELKLASFDPALAFALGFSPALLHYALMALVSVTAVGAFDAVGSILVVALMVGPPVTAYLLTDRLRTMVALAAGGGALGAVAGYWLAHVLDASIAGSIATVIGLEFLGAFLFAPDRGLVALARRRSRQRVRFAETMLAIHLLNHEGRPEAAREARVEHLRELLRWDDAFAERIVRTARRDGLVVPENGSLRLTAAGRALAAAAIAEAA
ncbi:MAG TPA: metal ABC transporter permease [Gaiellaceae bacterium]|jgi:manganese/zinc/iron transport system permease protein|nr:metal ABC transporter permease [Gaiellaceae bacterium]